jgi:hypothetical protein
MTRSRRIIRRIAAKGGLIGGPRVREIRLKAIECARLNMGDEEARDHLYGRLSVYDEEEERTALAGLGEGGTSQSYLRERARRLLESVVEGRPVGAIAPASSDLLLRQKALGWKPIAEAYDDLAELEPRLIEFRVTVESWGNEQSVQGGHGIYTYKIRRLVRGAVGPKSQHGDALVKSSFALDIVYRYLYALSGYTELGTLETRYFDAPNMATGTLRDPRDS